MELRRDINGPARGLRGADPSERVGEVDGEVQRRPRVGACRRARHRPAPAGVTRHGRAREYLLAEPASLGWRAEVQQSVGAADRGTPGVQAVDDVAACVRAKKAQERGLRARKSSAISSNVAQRTPSWPLMCAINRSSMSST